ncbi:CAP domain-containing protein [Amaricoccus macauensis]|uniref:CAP domain-containing protein n=1 Tax=Amaricoccus macauensis TaxID=57001 RepID=UPI003C7A46C7
MQIYSSFDRGLNGFSYSDNAFGGYSGGPYAHGWHSSRAGFGADGGLIVRLGGRDDRTVDDISGGWAKTFEAESRSEAEVTFRYKITATPNFESNEYTELRLSLDGEAFGRGNSDAVARLRGDGDGGAWQSTGWQEVTISLGEIEAGNHELELGGFLNQKTGKNEQSWIKIDDVRIEVDPIGNTGGQGSGGSGEATGSGSDGLAAFEARVLELTNAFRVQNGVDPLEADARLTAAAEDWSREMAEGDMFRHSNTSAQVGAEGYDWRALGENIAAGYSTPEAVVQAWINSPGHRSNMLSENFDEIGIGHVLLENDGGNLRYNHYWTQIFATEADSYVF